MPRGVYDRSKMKNKNKTAKSTETVVHHAAPVAHKKPGPKGPRGRKPGSTNKPKATQAISQSMSAGNRADGQGLFLMTHARENLNTLTALQAQFKDIPSIRTEVEAHIEVLSDLRQELFPKRVIEKVETQTAQNNGTTAQPQFQQTVPMPPSVPVIPTTH